MNNWKPAATVIRTETPKAGKIIELGIDNKNKYSKRELRDAFDYSLGKIDEDNITEFFFLVRQGDDIIWNGGSKDIMQSIATLEYLKIKTLEGE